jgi:hypothetical protein
MDELHEEEDFRRRVEAGDWPALLRDGTRQGSPCYDYDRVLVNWKGGDVETYRIGSGRSGYPGDSALDVAQTILSDFAKLPEHAMTSRGGTG